jgi:DnaJ-domain-containing protein 1
VQPPSGALDHFARLGLASRFGHTIEAIEAAHAQRLARVHPDRFGRATATERGFAAAHAAHLNDALRVLELPHGRLTYLLALRGVEVGEAPLLRLRPSDADRMELIELRAALDELDGRDASVERARLARAVQERFEGLLYELAAALDTTPADGPLPFDVGRVGHLHALRRLIDEVAG